MLRLVGEQVESLFDEALPIEVRELPEELARLDGLLSDPALLAPIAERWEAEARQRGRPTIAMALFVRLMVIKQRTGWGYETLVREVSDSLHLRRFCGLSLTASVPHESTIRKLVRRLGPEVIDDITRALIDKAQRERHGSRPARCAATPRSWKPMCAGPRTPPWPLMARGDWHARASGSRPSSVTALVACRTARGRSAGGCG
jgi:hypothetical protein